MKWFVVLLKIIMCYAAVMPVFAQESFETENVAKPAEAISAQEEESASPTTDKPKPASSMSTVSFPSLLFAPNDIKLINKAEKSRDTNVPIEILLPELFGNQQAGEVSERPEVEGQAPSFSVQENEEDTFVYSEPAPELNPADTPIIALKSILYLSDEHWTIWMNDVKMTSSDEAYVIEDMDSDGIEVMSVGPKRIIAVWSGFPPSMVTDKVEERSIPLGDRFYASEDMQIVYDKDNKRLAFILEPHQALVPYLLRVIEGEGNARKALFEETKASVEPSGIDDDVAFDDSQNVDTQAQQEVTLDNVQPSIVKNLPDQVMQNKNMKNYMKQIDMLQSLLAPIDE